MKKHFTLFLAVVTILVVALAAVAQQRGGMQALQQRREAQMKALETLQQNTAKLRAAMETPGRGMQGRNFQDMSDEERAKLREEMTQRQQEQVRLTAEMEQAIAQLKGPAQLRQEYTETMAPLRELLAAAQNEKATATARQVEQLIAQRQKQFEDRITAMGYTMEMLERTGQRRRQQ
jgi:hypothetical protein